MAFVGPASESTDWSKYNLQFQYQSWISKHNNNVVSDSATINKSRQVSSISVDKAVGVLKALNTSRRQQCRDSLGQFKQFAHIVTLSMDEYVTTWKRTLSHNLTGCHYAGSTHHQICSSNVSSCYRWQEF